MWHCVFGSHSPVPHMMTGHALLLCLHDRVTSGLMCLDFSDILVTSIGIFSDPSILVHTSTVILSLCLCCPHDSFYFESLCFVQELVGNNSHSYALNMSFRPYLLRINGSTSISEASTSSSFTLLDSPFLVP